MSNIKYNGNIQAQHTLFTSARLRNGPLARRQGFNFAGTMGCILVGPDISLPGGITLNPPTAVGPIWSQAVANGPTVLFVQDTRLAWVRGHLVNGEWRGPGHLWDNLTPLTPVANHNHATVEGYMRTFCQASLTYENSGGTSNYKLDWYGVAYQAQCSNAPWAAAPANAELYSYAPAFIKISWRAVRIVKPNLQTPQVQAFLDGIGALTAVPAFPPGFNVPARPAAIAGAVVPAAGNRPGGAVYPAMAGYPAAQANGFDGDIEVHQS